MYASLCRFMNTDESVKGTHKSMFNRNLRSFHWQEELTHKCFYILLFLLLPLASITGVRIFLNRTACQVNEESL